jgi:hypothetical protein
MEMVVKHVFCFDVPAENMGNFVKWCADTSKPFFEKLPEVKSYDVYQTVAGKPTFVKEVVCADLNAFNSMWQKASDPMVQKVFGEFFSYVGDLESKLIMEIV